MSLDGKDILEKAAKCIFEKKGLNLLSLEVGEVSSVTNYLLIAEGMVDRHVAAMARTLVKEIREELGVRPKNIEGLAAGEWVLIDYVTVNIHLFKPGLREIYRLEQLWGKGKVISLDLKDQPA